MRKKATAAWDRVDPLISLTDICKFYQIGGEEVRANDGISLSINHGEFVAIMGKSGSGKSTTMNMIGALDVPTSGTYKLNGTDVSHMTEDQLAKVRNIMIGFIFQQYFLLTKLNVLENVELPLLYAGLSEAEQRERGMKALEQVGIGDKWNKYPNQLSGGQQQRVSIARALAGEPSLILADEPTGALDSKTSAEILDFLTELNSKGKTVVLITHDITVALKAKRVVQLSDGKIIFDGTAEAYKAHMLEEEKKAEGSQE